MQKKLNPLKSARVAIFSTLVLAGLTLTVAHAAGQTDYLSSREHCETQCTLGVQDCQTGISEDVDACLGTCDQDSCSRCDESLGTEALETCESQCDVCRHQCDQSFDSRRQACDSSEQACLAKCMGAP